MKSQYYIFSILLLLLTQGIDAQTDLLKQKIQQIIKGKNAELGFAMYGLEDKDTLSIHNTTHFPMQSVFKFHIALAVLNEVDKGRFSLTQNIFIKKSDLLPDTWSPLREDYPNGNVNVSLAKILGYTVSQSDNNGCDILLRLIGGEKVANRYLHSIGIKDVAIVANEEAMHKDWDVQFLNWTTPQATIALLKKFYERKMLSQKSHDFLWKIMVETSTGKNRIKAQLPSGTIVAHKTGTSGTNQAGITSAINDIGIVTLPNSKHFAICFYVANSRENEATNEKIIADISKLTWDYFVGKTKK